MTRFPIIWLILTLKLLISPLLQAKGNKTILVHYMPWYQSKEISGNWGWHWEMNKRFNPDQIDESGKRQIASHYYPIFGAYDSSDPDVIEAQVQLMKLSGIDGVIIDWYGRRQFRDYAFIHQCTQKLITVIKKAGLKFAICYEDRTIRPMVNTEQIPADQDIAEAQKEIIWLSENWFSDEAYVKVDNKPILLNFGPMYFRDKESWQKIFSPLSVAPTFFVLPHYTTKTKDVGANGAFGWPPVHGEKEITPTEWKSYLSGLYSKNDKLTVPIAVAFSGFRDIYEKSYGSIDHQNHTTFTQTLELALASEANIIQIATWNDYGESTIIEPTVEFGTKYLQILQDKAHTEHKYSRDSLQLPIELFKLRKATPIHPKNRERLNKISIHLLNGETHKAKELLKNYSGDY